MPRVSWLFLKRFIKRPMQVASVIPSSKVLVAKVAERFEFDKAKVVAEFGPGEGVHTRELVKRLPADGKLLLFEIDPDLATHLREEFAGDTRIEVLETDAAELPNELAQRQIAHCDYVLSGIPFSIMEPQKKKKLLQAIHDSLRPEPHSAFIIYQVTSELKQHAAPFFPDFDSEYCVQNIPPMFVIKFWRMPRQAGENKVAA